MGKAVLIALLIVLLVRCFLFESYTVSSSHATQSLVNGDRILVDKTAYGIRMPITILAIPFTFDNLLGMQSYTDAVQLPYKRLFESGVEKEDIVLYNNPMETDKPLDKRSLILNRCVAVAGDSVAIDEPSVYYKFVVPRKGTKVELTENNMKLYRNIILSEQGSAGKVEYDRLYINGEEQTSYTFLSDYYWMISDDKSGVPDSRTLGFIPVQSIIGKARIVWYSSENGNVRWDRCFSAIKSEN